MDSSSTIAPAAETENLFTLLNRIRVETDGYAFEELYEFCHNPKFKEAVCAREDLGLLSTLKDILQDSMDNEFICGWIFLCLANLTSDSVANRIAISSRELELLPILMNILRDANDETLIDYAETTMGNCSLTPDVHEFLLSSEVDWLSYLTELLKTRPDDTLTYWRFTNLISRMNDQHLSLILEKDIINPILRKLLSFGSNSSLMSKIDKDGILFRIYTFVANFSSIHSGRIYLKDYFEKNSEYCSCFLQLLDSPDIIGIFSTIILSNIYGRDENNQTTKSLLVEHKHILSRLVDLLDATINYDINRPIVIDLINKGFKYGPIKLHVLTSSIRNLSISDENKNIMIKDSKLIELSCQVIEAFLNNSVEFYGIPVGQTIFNYTGGGGKDLLTIENILELLLQLSFISDDENILNFTFNTNPHYNVKELLEKLINLPIERNLPYEVRKCSLQFLARLQSKPQKIVVVDEMIKNSTDSIGGIHGKQSIIIPKHIMLSYSWSANKHLVIAVANKLREKGYDVWRDEEGSSIMHPMSGDIVETMGGAVDKSHSVIIFVSPEYKESANCRQEAGYARARATNSGVKLIYVMMNENYHTCSVPRQVDGWLGFMIGSELWYPLFNERSIDSTVSSLVGLIGDNAKKSYNANSAHSGPMPPVPPSVGHLVKSASTGSSQQNYASSSTVSAFPDVLPIDADYEKAFAILNQPKKSLCPNTWPAFLKELSVEEPDDLKNFEPSKLFAFGEFLKSVPSAEFRKSLRF
jgi:hypothetical protein